MPPVEPHGAPPCTPAHRSCPRARGGPSCPNSPADAEVPAEVVQLGGKERRREKSRGLVAPEPSRSYRMVG